MGLWAEGSGSHLAGSRNRQVEAIHRNVDGDAHASETQVALPQDGSQSLVWGLGGGYSEPPESDDWDQRGSGWPQWSFSLPRHTPALWDHKPHPPSSSRSCGCLARPHGAG